MTCSICGAPAAWLFDARGVSGELAYCAPCLPEHFKPLIGSDVRPVIPQPDRPAAKVSVEPTPAPKPVPVAPTPRPAQPPRKPRQKKSAGR